MECSAILENHVNHPLPERYRCLDHLTGYQLLGELSPAGGYFRFGDGTLCYGRATHSCDGISSPACRDLLGEVIAKSGGLLLPFDPNEVIDNLRYERYVRYISPLEQNRGYARDLYYLLRRRLPTGVRRQLQRYYLRNWNKIPFPHWPVDVTVENLLERLLLLSMKAAGVQSTPFIWFWPDGVSSAMIITHDVETTAGRDFCSRLMDIDESFGFHSTFQIVPEERYSVPDDFLMSIRAREHEINVQDLNHDGRLFRDRARFSERAKLINDYGRRFGAKGFRSAVLYRDLSWYDQLEFEYDMSVPNVGHLEAQRGGCCTVFPYFIGEILEVPVTTTQDYSLFYVLRDYSIDVWKAQADAVEAKHGLLSFIVHPDYLLDKRAENTYRSLLAFLRRRGEERGTWMTTAGAVNDWWRQRAQMTLVCRNGTWRIEGPGKERARIAYATMTGDGIVYAYQD